MCVFSLDTATNACSTNNTVANLISWFSPNIVLLHRMDLNESKRHGHTQKSKNQGDEGMNTLAIPVQ